MEKECYENNIKDQREILCYLKLEGYENYQANCKTKRETFHLDAYKGNAVFWIESFLN